MESTAIKQISLKKAHQNKAFTAIRTIVKSNVSGYKFITILKGNSATNAYLGKKSSEMVLEGEDIQALLVDASIVKTVNEKGEARLKISLGGDSEYVSADSLFGASDELSVSEKEVLNFLETQYSTVTVNEVATEEVRN